ncbi:tyrosine-type recombinase/integrase [Actinoallomurus purpureus]|uniref:tyrosine-type recombinase/integrase n=1 Tax=Actinoallomurus purpureus TaxID=478114 RepID=UPI002093C5B4|nr:tyrosine-type recombinase/integrase [Actinoallomurus purpureus]MCO6010165.1 tyrosine-type recombinase/integrase [Actinoallomurus purpureus]
MPTLAGPRRFGDALLAVELASRRTVSIPRAIVPALRQHLDAYVGKEGDAFLFAGPKGKLPRRSNFRVAAGWTSAVEKLGAPGLRFHDLRHTGNMWAAPGTSLADLKARMGHASVRAAIIYQHATNKADQAIAPGLDALLKAQRDNREDDGDGGAVGVLVPVA